MPHKAAFFYTLREKSRLAPWALELLYGKAYTAASTATVLSLATAVAHMGNAPVAGRLTIVSIKQSGFVNTVWAVLVALSATFFLFHPGNARVGAAIILGAHVLSALLVLLALKRRSIAPPGVSLTFLIGLGTSLVMAVLAVAREDVPSLALPLNGALLVIFFTGISLVCWMGRRHHWLPGRAVIMARISAGVPLLRKFKSEQAHG